MAFAATQSKVGVFGLPASPRVTRAQRPRNLHVCAAASTDRKLWAPGVVAPAWLDNTLPGGARWISHDGHAPPTHP